MPQVLPYDEVAEYTYSLNSKQREAFKVVHTWEKDFVKNDRQNVKSIPIFLSGSERQVNLIWWKWYTTSCKKICFITVKIHKNWEYFLLTPIGVLAINVGGIIIHSGHGVKPEITLLGLNSKYCRQIMALRNRLPEFKFLIIDELSMVSYDLCTDIHSRLAKIFKMIP